MGKRPYDIRKRTYLFTRDSIVFGRHAVTLRDFVLNRLVYQLVDAAGSVGANLEEAGDGQSKPDFISKTCIALKEVREATFWLRQLRDAEPKRLGPVRARNSLSPWWRAGGAVLQVADGSGELSACERASGFCPGFLDQPAAILVHLSQADSWKCEGDVVHGVEERARDAFITTQMRQEWQVARH